MLSLIQELLSHFAQVLPAPRCSDDFFHLLRAQISLLNFKKGSKDTLESTFNSTCLSLRWLLMVCVEQFFIPLLDNKHWRNFKVVRRPGPYQNKFYTLLRKPKVVSQKKSWKHSISCPKCALLKIHAGFSLLLDMNKFYKNVN